MYTVSWKMKKKNPRDSNTCKCKEMLTSYRIKETVALWNCNLCHPYGKRSSGCSKVRCRVPIRPGNSTLRFALKRSKKCVWTEACTQKFITSFFIISKWYRQVCSSHVYSYSGHHGKGHHLAPSKIQSISCMLAYACHTATEGSGVQASLPYIVGPCLKILMTKR